MSETCPAEILLSDVTVPLPRLSLHWQGNPPARVFPLQHQACSCDCIDTHQAVDLGCSPGPKSWSELPATLHPDAAWGAACQEADWDLQEQLVSHVDQGCARRRSQDLPNSTAGRMFRQQCLRHMYVLCSRAVDSSASGSCLLQVRPPLSLACSCASAPCQLRAAGPDVTGLWGVRRGGWGDAAAFFWALCTGCCVWGQQAGKLRCSTNSIVQGHCSRVLLAMAVENNRQH